MAALAFWYRDSVWVQSEPKGDSNIWGVENAGAPLMFEYVPADWGAGYIACNQRRVCGASMTADGMARVAVPAAMDVPRVLNMVVQDAHSRAKCLDDTCFAIHKHTSTMAAQVNQAEANLDVLKKGVASGGVQEIQSRLSALKQQIVGLEAAASELGKRENDMSATLDKQTSAVNQFATTWAQQKATLESTAGSEMMTAKDRETLEAKLADLEKRLNDRLGDVDEQLRKKCECSVQ